MPERLAQPGSGQSESAAGTCDTGPTLARPNSSGTGAWSVSPAPRSRRSSV